MICAKKLSGFVLVSALIFSSSVFAQANPVPTKAPFATDATSPVSNGSKLMEIYDVERQEDIVPIDKPHRTTEQVATWVEDNIATVLNIDPVQWEAYQKKIAPQFDAYGFQEYQNYLKTSGIVDLLTTNHLRMNAIGDSSSVLLSQGALAGTYHWLYQMPVMLTYYDQDTKTLKKQKVRAQNQKIMVRVQVGRTRKGADDNNLVIERWSVTPLR